MEAVSSSSSIVIDPLDKIKLPQNYISDEYRIHRVLMAMKPIVLKVVEIFSKDEYMYLSPEIRLGGYLSVLKRYELSDKQFKIPPEFFVLLKRNFQQYATNDVDIIKQYIPDTVFDLPQQQKFLNDFQNFMATLQLCFP